TLSNIFLGIGILCLILGTGNVLLCHSRGIYYQGLINRMEEAEKTTILSQKNAELLTKESERGAGALPKSLRRNWSGSEPDPGDQAQLEKLESRYAFYRFCVLGGKSLLALSGILLLSGILIRRGAPLQSDSDQTEN
ncbi:MAG: hypothetical protein KDD64_17055, partial [Bdellovibrionales bacterium]|nr:hypothetical protein [Bdellovibrionales bacterium]